MQPVVITQEQCDAEHLRLLSIFHYINGGLTVLFSSFALIHLLVGITMILYPELMKNNNGAMPPASIGWFFAIVGGLIVIIGWVFGALQIYSGRLLAKHKRRLFSSIIAGINCLNVPLGTVLGVFTLIVLSRQSVKLLYQESDPS